MAYTTVSNVIAMFPGFQENAANSVQDATITLFINRWTGRINAVLRRRFSEAITAAAGSTFDLQFAAWTAAFNSDQLAVLEELNALGAAGELDHAFEVTAPGFAANAKEYGVEAEAMLAELDGRDAKGNPKKDGGRYDKLFDSLSRSISPRPDLDFIAGADTVAGETASDTGTSNVFSKFDRSEE